MTWDIPPAPKRDSPEIRRCRGRVLKYERLIRDLKKAYEASEMTNYHVALQKLFRALEEI